MMARGLIRTVAWLTLGFLALPLMVIIGASVTATGYLAFPPRGVTFEWYRRVLGDPSYVDAFVTSTWLAAAATLCAILLAIPASLALASRSFPGRGAALAFFMSPMVLPHIVLGTALLQFTAALGLMRTFGALLLGHVVIVAPFVVRAVLPQLTRDKLVLQDAAADLGAGPVTAFFLITLPLIRSAVVSGSIFAFISSWINVELSIFNTGAELTTIPVKLFNYVQYTIDPTIAAVAAITIAVAAVTIVILDCTIGIDAISERR
jgi:putative spermidine/putrescine transport system permease protein